MSEDLEKENTDNPVLSALSEIVEDAKKEASQNILFDSQASQKIPLKIRKGTREFDVAIEFAPSSDEEWFELMEAIPAAARRLKSVSVELFAPYAALGRNKAVARYGYADNPNWKTATRDSDYISAMKGYFDVWADTETVETSKELLDDEAESPVKLISNFNERECETQIFFQEASKDQTDEFMGALAGLPNKTALASAKKVSKERRLYALYTALKTREENYSDRIPAWHAVEAVTAFFNMEMQRLGKF